MHVLGPSWGPLHLAVRAACLPLLAELPLFDAWLSPLPTDCSAFHFVYPVPVPI